MTAVSPTWIAKITVVPCIAWDGYKLLPSASAILVFAFPGCQHQVVTADGTLNSFLRTDVVELCTTSKRGPRYQNSIEKARCQSSVFPVPSRGKQEKLALDRANFAKFVQYITSVKPRGTSATQQRVSGPLIPFTDLFGQDLTLLFNALDVINQAWTVAVERQTAPIPFCCEFYHACRTPIIYGLNNHGAVELAVPAVPQPQPATVPPPTSFAAPKSRKRGRQPDENTAAEYDPVEDDIDPYQAKRSLPSPWSQLAQSLSNPPLDSRIKQAIVKFMEASAVGATEHSPFLSIQALCEQVQPLTAYEVCEYVVSLGYIPWYFNRLNRSELSVYGVRTHKQRVFILDEDMERKVKQTTPAPLKGSTSEPIAKNNDKMAGVTTSDLGHSSSSFMTLVPDDIVDSLLSDLSQGIRGTPMHKRVQSQS